MSKKKTVIALAAIGVVGGAIIYLNKGDWTKVGVYSSSGNDINKLTVYIKDNSVTKAYGSVKAYVYYDFQNPYALKNGGSLRSFGVTFIANCESGEYKYKDVVGFDEFRDKVSLSERGGVPFVRLSEGSILAVLPWVQSRKDTASALCKF